MNWVLVTNLVILIVGILGFFSFLKHSKESDRPFISIAFLVIPLFSFFIILFYFGGFHILGEFHLVALVFFILILLSFISFLLTVLVTMTNLVGDRFILFIYIAIYIVIVIFSNVFSLDWYKEDKIARQEHEVEQMFSSFLKKVNPNYEAKQMVFSFLKEMNPKLNQKITKIAEEIVVADNKIQQLQALKAEYPNQQIMIDEKLNQWYQLRKQLNQVSNRIYYKVERAYVIYKIAKIREGNTFSLLSTKLLTEANTALTMAESTKQAIEEGTK